MSAPALSKPLTYKETDGVRHGRVGPYWWDANLVCWSFGTGSGDTVLGSGECRGYEDADAQVRAAIRKHLSDAGLAQGAGLDAVLGRLRGLVRAKDANRMRIELHADGYVDLGLYGTTGSRDPFAEVSATLEPDDDSLDDTPDAALRRAFPKEWQP